jgi:hypothetical protein
MYQGQAQVLALAQDSKLDEEDDDDDIDVQQRAADANNNDEDNRLMRIKDRVIFECMGGKGRSVEHSSFDQNKMGADGVDGQIVIYNKILCKNDENENGIENAQHCDYDNIEWDVISKPKPNRFLQFLH